MLNRISLALMGAALPFAVSTEVQAQTIADAVIAASGGMDAGMFDDNRRDYDILLNAIGAADPSVLATLQDASASLTVFAPDDRAFIRLARDLGYMGANDEGMAWSFLVQTLTAVAGGPPTQLVTDILLYHVAPREISAFGVILRSIFRRTIDTALAGASIRPFFFVLIDNDPDFRNPFLQAPINLRADNGIVHGISRVLIPVDL